MAAAKVMAMWLATAAAGAGEPPATAPAARAWSEPKAGVSISAAPVGDWRLDGPMKLSFAIRNCGAMAVTLPPAEDFFGYVLIGQRRRAYYTEKIPHGRGLASWPRRLESQQVVELPTVDAGKLKACLHKRGLLLRKGYPVEIVGGKPVARAAAGKVAELLKIGPVKIRYMAYLDRERGGALRLEGKAVRIVVGLSSFAALNEQTKQRLLGDLAERMRKDAWSAKAAHADAVRFGRPAVGALLKIAGDAQAPSFTRMWAVTALADIGGPDAVDFLIQCLRHKDTAVRHVAAYHGLKLDSAKFDAAAKTRALAGYWPMLTAWTLLGYVQFRGRAPPELVAAGVDSKQERVRAAVARVFTRIRPVPAQMPFLHRLARDPVEKIRYAAVMSLGASGDASAETVEAMIACLVLPGETARHAAAGNLSKLVGKDWRYPVGADEEDKQAVVRRWREWWASAKDTYKPPK